MPSRTPARPLLVFALICLYLLAAALPAYAQDTPAAPDAGGKVFMPAVRRQVQPVCACQADAASALAAGAAIPNQYVVMLHDADVRAAAGDVTTAAAFAADVAQRYGGTILFTYDALDGFAATLPPTAVDALKANPSVALVEPDRVIAVEPLPASADAAGAPTDLSALVGSVDLAAPAAANAVTWGLDRIDQRDLPLNGAFSPAAAGAGVHVYVIDTGVRMRHTEFSGRTAIGFSTIADGNGINDCNGHGTHVAGTILGKTLGVARAAIVHPVRVLNACGKGSNSGVIAGVDWVAKNAIKPAVANMSLGGSVSLALDAAVQKAITAGITFVVAAGNENDNACFYSPADTPAAITVGATARGDWRSDFSNFGTCVDIFAPGSDITSAWYTSDTALNTISGTSMASPHVTGIAAAYLSTRPAATPAQVAAALVASATTGRVSALGVGSPNRLLFTAFTASPAFACSDIIANGGFESGPTVWQQSSSNGWDLICTQTSCSITIFPRSGTYFAWLGGDDNETSRVAQKLTLPAGKSAMLSFWYTSFSTDSCGRDYGRVQVKVNGAVVKEMVYNLCSSTTDKVWHNSSLNLSDLAGKNVEIIFGATTNGSIVSNFWVDDIRLRSGVNCAVAGADADAEAALEPPVNTPDFTNQQEMKR